VLLPLIWQATIYDVKTMTYTMSGTPHEGPVQGDDAIKSLTSDGLQVEVDLSIQFHVDPEKVAQLHQEIGPHYLEKVVRPEVRSDTRMVISEFRSTDIYAGVKRQEIEKRLKERLAPRFAAAYLVLENVLLRSVQFRRLSRRPSNASKSPCRRPRRWITCSSRPGKNGIGKSSRPRGKPPQSGKKLRPWPRIRNSSRMNMSRACRRPPRPSWPTAGPFSAWAMCWENHKGARGKYGNHETTESESYHWDRGPDLGGPDVQTLVIVPAGYRAVLYNRAGGGLRQVGEGMHWKTPLLETVEALYDVRTRTYTMSATHWEGEVRGDDSLAVQTADGPAGQPGHLRAVPPDRDKVALIHQAVGRTTSTNSSGRPSSASHRTWWRTIRSPRSIPSPARRSKANWKNGCGRSWRPTTSRSTRCFCGTCASPGVREGHPGEADRRAGRRADDLRVAEGRKEKQQKIIEAEGEAQAIRLKGQAIAANAKVVQYEYLRKIAPTSRSSSPTGRAYRCRWQVRWPSPHRAEQASNPFVIPGIRPGRQKRSAKGGSLAKVEGGEEREPIAFAVVCQPRFPTGRLRAVYFVQGYHGGYYLTPEAPYREALDKLFDLLEHNPQFQVVLELEPYTLERMQGGEKFDCERFGRGQPTLTGWTLGGQGDYAVSVAADAARSGQQGLRIIFRGGAYAHALAAASAEKFRGRDLLFAGWIRQRQGRGAHLYIDAWDEVQYLAGSALRTPAVPDDGNWHRVEMTWRVPDNAFRLLPQAKCDGEPTDADFDDLSLKDAETGEEVLSHGGFEEVAEPTLRDEARLEKLRRFVQRGQMEIVGGAYTQPILYAIGDESALRQFVYGTRAVEGALGIPVKIYAAQEPGMCAQLPQILRQAGFEHVLYRTIWGIFGAPPHRNAENVWWIGNDGSKIQAVPSYAVFPLPRYGLTTHPSRQLIEGLERAGIPRPLFVALHDFVTETVPEPDSPLLRNEFGDGWANLCRRIPASPLRGREVVFSGAIRARQGGAHLYIDSHDAGGIALSGVQSKNVAPDGQWHDVQIRYLVPDHAVELFPQGRMISASGEADFDALRLTTADGAVVVDASFETGTLEGFGVGTSEGTLAQHQVVEGDAAAGQRFVTLQMNAPQIQAQVATLGEYFQRIGKPQETWYDAFKGFEFRFPFGLLSGEVQRADRESENLLLQTERLLAIAGVDAQGLLDDAWEAHLMGEHHDGWVCAPVVFGIWKQPTYAQMCFAAFDEAKRLGQQLMQDAGCWLPDADGKVRVRGERLRCRQHRLFCPQRNGIRPPDASPRRRQAAGDFRRLPIPSLHRPSKTVVLSRHDDGSAREVEAVLLAQVPAMGYQRYKVVEGPPSPSAASQGSARRAAPGG
jgi:regulator of protease activity HflC (stomatin/prohibitin superfamily)